MKAKKEVQARRVRRREENAARKVVRIIRRKQGRAQLQVMLHVAGGSIATSKPLVSPLWCILPHLRDDDDGRSTCKQVSKYNKHDDHHHHRCQQQQQQQSRRNLQHNPTLQSMAVTKHNKTGVVEGGGRCRRSRMPVAVAYRPATPYQGVPLCTSCLAVADSASDT